MADTYTTKTEQMKLQIPALTPLTQLNTEQKQHILSILEKIYGCACKLTENGAAIIISNSHARLDNKKAQTIFSALFDRKTNINALMTSKEIFPVKNHNPAPSYSSYPDFFPLPPLLQLPPITGQMLSPLNTTGWIAPTLDNMYSLQAPTQFNSLSPIITSEVSAVCWEFFENLNQDITKIETLLEALNFLKENINNAALNVFTPYNGDKNRSTFSNDWFLRMEEAFPNNFDQCQNTKVNSKIDLQFKCDEIIRAHNLMTQLKVKGVIRYTGKSSAIEITEPFSNSLHPEITKFDGSILMIALITSLEEFKTAVLEVMLANNNIGAYTPAPGM